jgi:hypothetical protein
MEDRGYEAAKKVVLARREFYGHAVVYFIVNSMLFMLDYVTPGGPWFYWPLFGWGIGLLIHAVMTFTGLAPGSEAEERAIRRYMRSHAR